MKPPLKYRGGKARELPQIIGYIPRFKGRYIEPFFGGGALFFHLQPKRALINDINPKLMSFYRGVRDDFDGIQDELLDLERKYRANRQKYEILKRSSPLERVEDANETLYYSIREMYNGTSKREYSDAAIYYFINKTAYSGMIRYNSRGEFNVPYGRYANLNSSMITRAHSRLLSNAELFSVNYSCIFKLAQSDDFMFLDPPYDCTFNDYGNLEQKDGFGELDHRKLAEEYFKLQCKAMMVIARTPLIEELYGGNVVGEYSKDYSVNIKNRFKSKASHLVVTNYNIDLQVGESTLFSEVEKV